MKMNDFWWFVSEREVIRLRKESGQPDPLTSDERLRRFWFPNIKREHDRTSVWFRAMVQNAIHDQQTLLLAIVTFRLFSRIEVGELLLPMLTSVGYERTALLNTLGPTREHLFNARVAYGMLPRSLGAAVRILDDFYDRIDEYAARLEDFSLQRSHQVLARSTGIGQTLAYEIVCDLRRTAWMPHPLDALTWAAPTPMVCAATSMMLNQELRPTREADRLAVIDFMRSLLPKACSMASASKSEWELSEVHRALCLYYIWAREACPTRRYHKWNS